MAGRLTMIALATIALATAGAAQQAPRSVDLPVNIARLDCGTIRIKEFNSFFSDAHDFAPGPREVTNSCYLIRHGPHYLLWDSGLPGALRGTSMDMGAIVGRLDRTVQEQLAQLGVGSGDVTIVGISHMHSDHTGQAATFGKAELLIGKEDFTGLRGKDDPLKPWRAKGAKVRLVGDEDVDVFGDGKVIALRMPGHTPDHLSLLVRLESGPILLTGDLYHSREAREKGAVPPFNTDRADTLASMDRFEKLVRNLDAKVIIQHEPKDISRIPAFPAWGK